MTVLGCPPGPFDPKYTVFEFERKGPKLVETIKYDKPRCQRIN